MLCFLFCVVFFQADAHVALNKDNAAVKDKHESKVKVATKDIATKKVILLLERIKKTIANQGADEAKQYDDFACFCKEQADGKTYAIDKSLDTEERLKNMIEAKTTEKRSLDAQVKGLLTSVATVQREMFNADLDWKAELAAYVNSQRNFTLSITAIQNAFDVLKGSQDNMTDFKAGYEMLQGNKIAQNILKKKMKQDPGAASYAFSSDSVLALLSDLLKEFKADKAKLEEEHLSSRDEHKETENAQRLQVIAKLKAAGEKNATSSQLALEVSEHITERREEKADRKADEKFLRDLTKKCEDKAEQWDQRSRVRGGELEAISEAIKYMGGADKVYSSTETLRTNATIDKYSLTSMKKILSKRMESNKIDVAEIQREAKETEEYMDSVAFLQVYAKHIESTEGKAKDPYVKLRSMISGLISSLKQEGRDSRAEFAWCESEMQRTTEVRDNLARQIKMLGLQIEKEQDRADQLKEDIAELAIQIANLTKGVNEATILWKDEHTMNLKIINESTTGRTAVQNAIDALNNYYNNINLIETSDEDSQAPKADRHGNSVSDLAPETFADEDYGGTTSVQTHVVALLQDIYDTFDHTVGNTTRDDGLAETAFKTFRRTTNRDIDAKTTSKETKEGLRAQKLLDKEQHIRDVEDNQALLDETMGEVDRLKGACQASQMGDARAAERKQEIASLNQVLGMIR